MRLVLTEEQQMLAETAEQLVKETSPLTRFRALRDDRDAAGYSPEIWKQLAELGFLGVHLPEEHGGMGLGLLELSLLLEQAGRRLMPEPFVSTLLLGSYLLLDSGSDAQKNRWLPAIASGDAIVAVALDEPRSRYAPTRCSLGAERTETGYRLSGERAHVLDAHAADVLLVLARTSGERDDSHGLTLFEVDPSAAGVSIERHVRVDGHNAANVRLDGVEVSESAIVGNVDVAWTIIEPTLDRAAVGLSAMAIGGADEAFDISLNYLKERKQFGVAIGSFQALQHRASRLFVEMNLARAATRAAAWAADNDADRLPKLASLAKAQSSRFFVHAANEGVQFHGGVGVTDEFDIGLYLKRARACDITFGDAAYHIDRWAQLSSY